MKSVIFVKNKVMEDGHNVHVNFVANGSIRIVINTFKQELIFSPLIMRKFITALFAEIYKKDVWY